MESITMRNLFAALLVAAASLAAGFAAHAQKEVYTVWVMKNGDGPQPFFFGYGRTLEIAERIALGVCGEDCRVLKSGRGCLSIVVQNQEFLPRGCVSNAAPETRSEGAGPRGGAV